MSTVIRRKPKPKSESITLVEKIEHLEREVSAFDHSLRGDGYIHDYFIQLTKTLKSFNEVMKGFLGVDDGLD